MRAGAIAAVLILSGCTASTPIVDPTPTDVSPSPTETAKAKTPRAVRAAVIVDDQLFAYEVKTDTVTELATGSGLEQPLWLNKRDIAVAQRFGTVSSIEVVDSTTRSSRELLRVNGDLFSFDVSDDQGMVATMTLADGFATVDLNYLIGERAVQRVTAMPVEGRGLSFDDQFLVALSPDEQRLLIVNTASPDGTGDTAALQVRRLDGSLEYSVDSDRAPTAAAWLPSGGLVFKSLDGVRRWKPGSTSSVGVASLSVWYSPSASPNAKAVAYDTGRLTRRVQVRRVILATGEVTDVGPTGRANPIFAATNQIWTQIVQRCEPDCQDPFVLGPVVYAINPSTGKERVLQLPSLERIAVWYA